MSSQVKILDGWRDLVTRSGRCPDFPQEWEPEPGLLVRVVPTADGWEWNVVVFPEEHNGSVTITGSPDGLSVTAEGAVLPRHLARALAFVGATGDSGERLVGLDDVAEYCGQHGPVEALKQLLAKERDAALRSNDSAAYDAFSAMESRLLASGSGSKSRR